VKILEYGYYIGSIWNTSLPWTIWLARLVFDLNIILYVIIGAIRITNYNVIFEFDLNTLIPLTVVE